MPWQAVFLDRDGVLTPRLGSGEYLLKEDQIQLLPEALEPLRQLQSMGLKLFIVTNQSCVNRNLISSQEATKIQQRVLELLAEQGIGITDSRLCPHVDADACACRKPKPGMIEDLCLQHGVDPLRSAVVGDSLRDVHAGFSAGCRLQVLLQEGAEIRCAEGVWTCPTLQDMIPLLK